MKFLYCKAKGEFEFKLKINVQYNSTHLLSNYFSRSDIVQGAKYKAVYLTGNQTHLLRPKPQLQLQSQLLPQIVLADACFHRRGCATLLSQREDALLESETGLLEETLTEP